MSEINQNIANHIDIKESDGSWKRIGYIHKHEFRKVISGKKHIYNKSNSIGIDADIFQKFIVPHTHVIKVLDRDTDILYTVRTSVFNNMKSYLHFKPHRAQVFLPIKLFTKKTRKKK
jgi:hypothetical protein